MPIKIYNSIRLIKRYYMPLRHAYNILLKELPDLPKEKRLQIVIKAINNTVNLNSIMLILLVFGAFPRIL